MKKKILIIIPSFEVGGFVSALRNMLKYISTPDRDISIFTLYHQGDCRNYFPEDCILPKNKFLDAWFCNFSLVKSDKVYVLLVKLLKRLFLTLHINLEDFIINRKLRKLKSLNFNTVIAYAEGDATKVASFLPSETKVAWVHCNLKYSNIDNKIYTKYYLRYNVVVCVSKYTLEVFNQEYPSVENAIYLYNILDKDLLISKSYAQECCLQSLQDNTSVIVSIGRIDKIKQFSVIPEIAKAVAETCSNFKWFIVGSGNKDEERLIENKIHECDVEDIVKLIGFRNNIAPVMKRANLYVSTSISEACPMVFLEANALGTYIISNNFPSAYEFVNEHTGIVCSIEEMPQIIAHKLTNSVSVKYDDSYFADSIDKVNKLL